MIFGGWCQSPFFLSSNFPKLAGLNSAILSGRFYRRQGKAHIFGSLLQVFVCFGAHFDPNCRFALYQFHLLNMSCVAILSGWSCIGVPRNSLLLLVTPPCPATQNDLLIIIFRRRNWYYTLGDPELTVLSTFCYPP